MDALKDWFEQLDESEKKTVSIAAIALVIVIILFGIILPLNKKVASLENQVAGKQKLLNEWKKSIPTILANRGNSSSSNSTRSINSIVTSSTRKFNLSISRVQEKSDNEMQVWLDNVSFNDFIRWTEELQSRYQLQVASVNIRGKDRNGLSSIDIKLRRG
jgi:general secretion pathway protein M